MIVCEDMCYNSNLINGNADFDITKIQKVKIA